MDGLDDAVRGLSADESATFQTALLQGPNAGETADVTVTVRSVKTKELPELDDEFASTASEFDTLEELRDDVRTRLARTKVLQQGAQARDKLVEHLLETVEVPVPEGLVEREIEWRNRAMQNELQQAGMDWDSFLQMSGVESQEAYDADQRKNIEEAVRTQFILDAVADAREVTVDNEDLSAQIMAQAQRNRMSPEQYAQQLQQGGNIAEFVADVRRTKTLAQLLEQTTITDASGNVVDLEALRPRTVQAPADDADEAGTEDAEDAEEAPDAEVAAAVAVEATEGATEDTEDVAKGCERAPRRTPPSPRLAGSPRCPGRGRSNLERARDVPLDGGRAATTPSHPGLRGGAASVVPGGARPAGRCADGEHPPRRDCPLLHAR
jgi:trigger factor